MGLILAPVALGLTVASCSLSALDVRNPGVDDMLVTHSIPAPGADVPPTFAPGADAAAAALAGALGEGEAETPLAWEDSASDVRGQVTHLGVEDDACRDFVTTRESFDGVALYRGRLCRDEAGAWQMHAFAPL